MGSLQGPVVCPSVHPKVGGFCSLSMIGPMNVRCVGTEFWGLKEFNRGFLSCHVKIRKSETKVRSSLDSSSNGGGSMADSFDENDEDYVNSSVIEAGMFSYYNLIDIKVCKCDRYGLFRVICM